MPLQSFKLYIYKIFNIFFLEGRISSSNKFDKSIYIKDFGIYRRIYYNTNDICEAIEDSSYDYYEIVLDWHKFFPRISIQLKWLSTIL